LDSILTNLFYHRGYPTYIRLQALKMTVFIQNDSYEIFGLYIPLTLLSKQTPFFYLRLQYKMILWTHPLQMNHPASSGGAFHPGS